MITGNAAMNEKQNVIKYHFHTKESVISYNEFHAFIENVNEDFVPPFLPRFNTRDCYDRWLRLAELIICKAR